MEKELVETAGDFYRLTFEDILALEGFAEISTNNLLNSIEESKKRPFSRVLYALGLEGVGSVTSKSLVAHFGSIDKLMAAKPEEIEETPGIGPIVANGIAAQLADPQMQALIADLRSIGLNLEQAGPPPSEGPLRGLTFVLTGTLPNLTREQAQEKIMASGGKITSSVSSKTSYVVAGESPGSKFERAQQLGIEVIDEGRLLELTQ